MSNIGVTSQKVQVRNEKVLHISNYVCYAPAMMEKTVTVLILAMNYSLGFKVRTAKAESTFLNSSAQGRQTT